MTRVLVIEDDADIREVLVEALRDDGYQVDEAADGLAGLQLMRENAPQLAVIDLMMPGIDGRAFIEACHKDPHAADMRIVVVTAAHVRRITGIEADAIIQKPFDLTALMDVVADLAPVAATP